MMKYSEMLVFSRGLAAYWMPAFAGMTGVLCLHALLPLYRKQPLASQKREQWQQRQT